MSCLELQDDLAAAGFDDHGDLLEPAAAEHLREHQAACSSCAAESEALTGFLASWRHAARADCRPLSAGLRQRALAQPNAQAEPDAQADIGIRRLAPSRIPRVCAFCHDRLKAKPSRLPGDAMVLCMACRAPHHAACFRQHGGCSTLGCETSEFQLTEPPPPSRRRFPWGLARLAATLVLCAGGGVYVYAGLAATRDGKRVRMGRSAAALAAAEIGEGLDRVTEEHWPLAPPPEPDRFPVTRELVDTPWTQAERALLDARLDALRARPDVLAAILVSATAPGHYLLVSDDDGALTFQGDEGWLANEGWLKLEGEPAQLARRHTALVPALSAQGAPVQVFLFVGDPNRGSELWLLRGQAAALAALACAALLALQAGVAWVARRLR